MDAHDRLLRIVNEIYAAVGDPERWTRCLASICELLGGSAANLMHHDYRDHRGGVSASIIEPAAFEEYSQHFHRVDPWALELRPGALLPGSIVRGSALVPHDEFKRTEFYNDFGRRFGFTRTLIGVIDVIDNRLTTGVTINRSDAQPDFDDESERLLGALMPHLRRALALHEQLAATHAARGALADVLDRLRAGVVLLNVAGDVLTMNRAATQLAERRDGFIVERRRVRAATADATAALTQAIVSAVAVAQGKTVATGNTRVGLPKPSGGQALDAAVTPVAGADVNLPHGAAAVLFVTDPDAVPTVPADWLRGRYKLTPAEARVASALAQGESVNDIADRLRLTAGTTRWYVKQILSKTGTSRQADLVRLLVGIVAGMGLQ
jgi:DNA-binding NarL/FixJ family response regulator